MGGCGAMLLCHVNIQKLEKHRKLEESNSKVFGIIMFFFYLGTTQHPNNPLAEQSKSPLQVGKGQFDDLSNEEKCEIVEELGSGLRGSLK